MAKYVPYGSKCRCAVGTMENYLSTNTGHGLLFSGNPLMNANDHVVGINITHFGECAILTARANGFPQKCAPILPVPWIMVNKTHLIEGAPALTMDSLLPCFNGGVISITSLPPTPEDSVEERTDTAEKEKLSLWDKFVTGASAVGEAVCDISGKVLSAVAGVGVSIGKSALDTGALGCEIIDQVFLGNKFFDYDASLRESDKIVEDIAIWTGNPDWFYGGKIAGDIGTMVAGAYGAVSGLTAAAAGITVTGLGVGATGTGVGALVGVPAIAVSVPVVATGAAVAGASLAFAKSGFDQFGNDIEQFKKYSNSDTGEDISSKNIQYGSNSKSSNKLSSQMDARGWTKEIIEDTVDNPFTTRSSWNKATGNKATVFYKENGAYVIVDNKTKEIVQISDNINPGTWIPDSSIINPYIP